MFARPIAVSTLHQWLSAPLVWLSVIGLPAFGTLGVFIGILFMGNRVPESQYLGSIFPPPYIVILGTGIIGRDLSQGVLSLVFARPLTRANYILTKWLTLSLASLAIGLAQVVAVHLIYSAAAPTAAALSDALNCLGTVFLTCFGLSAALVLFSALVSGSFAGTGLWLLATISVLVTNVLSNRPAFDIPPADHPVQAVLIQVINPLLPVAKLGSDLVGSLLINTPKLETLYSNNLVDWTQVTAYLFNLILCLVLAIYVINRKELSYASN